MFLSDVSLKDKYNCLSVSNKVPQVSTRPNHTSYVLLYVDSILNE